MRQDSDSKKDSVRHQRKQPYLQKLYQGVKLFKLIADPLHELSKKLTKVLVITQLETVLSNLKTQLQHLALLTKKSQITESSCMQWNNPDLNIGD